jgi:hypothetical protein
MKDSNNKKGIRGLFKKGNKKKQIIEIKDEPIVKEEEESLEVEKIVPTVDTADEKNSIARPKEMIPTKAIYVKQLDLKSYCDDFLEYAKECGIAIHKNVVRELFSALAASKLIVVSNDDEMVSERFIELFTEFVGGTFFSSVYKQEINHFEDLFVHTSSFRNAIISANDNKNMIHFSTLRGVNTSNLPTYYDKVCDYSWNPECETTIRNVNFDAFENMPKNLWFFAITKDQVSFDTLKFAHSAVLIELNAKIIESKDKVEERQKKLNYESFINILEDGYDSFYFTETQWKKFDQVHEYLKKYGEYEIDNRLFRQLERYSSTFLMVGGDVYECIDRIVYNKLLFVIRLLDLTKIKDREETIFQLFERLFGLGNLTKSKDILKNIDDLKQEN